MKFSEIYMPYLLMKGFSVFAGEQKEWVKIPAGEAPDTPLMRAFMEDNDIQEISYTSTNIGLARTWRKVYHAQAERAAKAAGGAE